MDTTNPTLQQAIVNRLKAHPALTTPEPGGFGFRNVWPKWLLESGAGSEPAEFGSGGRILPNIVVLTAERNPHPSPNVPGWSKYDQFIPIYLFHYPGDHGKVVLRNAEIAVEDWLTHPSWVPVITGGQLPVVQNNPGVIDIDNQQQFPGNYVVVLRFRVTGLRAVPVS
jgi:hypothetical protein